MTEKEMLKKYCEGKSPFDLVIDKWTQLRKKIDKLRLENLSGANCALCHSFSCDTYKNEIGFEKCPIAIESGKFSCIGTPYRNVSASFRELLRKRRNMERGEADATF